MGRNTYMVILMNFWILGIYYQLRIKNLWVSPLAISLDSHLEDERKILFLEQGEGKSNDFEICPNLHNESLPFKGNYITRVLYDLKEGYLARSCPLWPSYHRQQEKKKPRSTTEAQTQLGPLKNEILSKDYRKCVLYNTLPSHQQDSHIISMDYN